MGNESRDRISEAETLFELDPTDPASETLSKVNLKSGEDSSSTFGDLQLPSIPNEQGVVSRKLRDTIKSADLPAVPDPQAARRNPKETMTLIQFASTQGDEAAKLTQLEGDEIHEYDERRTCKKASILILLAISAISRDPAYANQKDSIVIYNREFRNFIELLEKSFPKKTERERTKDLLFHVVQKIGFLKSIMHDFPKAEVKDLLQNTLEMLEGSRINLLARLQ